MSLTAALLSTAPDLEIIHADEDYIVAWGPSHIVTLFRCRYRHEVGDATHWHTSRGDRDSGVFNLTTGDTAEDAVSALLEKLNEDHPAGNEHSPRTTRSTPRQPGSD